MTAVNETARTLYVIDDESLINELICTAGEMLGYKVRAFASAAEFLELDSLEDPDLLLVDIFMPGIDGFELLDRLDARGLKSKVMVMSGKGNTFLDAALNVYEGQGIDVVGKLAKPCSVSKIMEMLDMKRIFADETPNGIDLDDTPPDVDQESNSGQLRVES